MVFLLLQRWRILYGTIKIQKKILQGYQNLCQSHIIQYKKLKKRAISKWEIWLWQRFWVPGEIFFWIFVVPYKISHLFDNKNTIQLKIYPCFLSEITIYNFQFDPTNPVHTPILCTVYLHCCYITRTQEMVVNCFLPEHLTNRLLCYCIRTQHQWSSIRVVCLYDTAAPC